MRVALGSSFVTEADNVHVHGGHVFAQFLQHISKSAWNRFNRDAYWWWVIASTDGLMQTTRYNVGSKKHRGDTTKKSSFKWYVRGVDILPQPVYSHLANGTRVQGSLIDLVSAVQSGQDIRCISGKTYSFPLQNVACAVYPQEKRTYTNKRNAEYVFGQNVDHISVMHANNRVQFQNNPYWWFSSVTSRGLREMSRWTVGIHQPRGHTNDTVDIEWFADRYWMGVFSHDLRGRRLSGSRQALVKALSSGHRIRFQIPAWYYYTAGADSLHVRKGHVTAQALKHVSMNVMQGASWFWLMVSTTGTVRVTMYKIGDNKRLGDSTYRKRVKWFVDTKPWEKVLSNDRFGNVLNGNRTTLVQSVNAGADVRCVVGDEKQGYAYKAQNLALSPDGNHVAAQSVNQVSVKSTRQKELMIMRRAYWGFTLVSTSGFVDISRWEVGKHKSRGHTLRRAGREWFVNN